MMKCNTIFNTVLLVFSFCLFTRTSLTVAETAHGVESEAQGNNHESQVAGSGLWNETQHGNKTEKEEEEHHEEEHHEEEHHAGHYIIWPSAAGMMLFITLCGYLFYHFYTRVNMKKMIMNDGHSFFQEAVIASTVTGIAAPGILAFDEHPTNPREFAKSIRHPRKPTTRREFLKSRRIAKLQNISEDDEKTNNSGTAEDKL